MSRLPEKTMFDHRTIRFDILCNKTQELCEGYHKNLGIPLFYGSFSSFCVWTGLGC